MAEYLRSDEILACVHRIALARGAPFDFDPPPETPELGRRRRQAREHREATLERLRELHPDAGQPTGRDETTALLEEGRELVLLPRLASDDEARRSAAAQVLVRVGRLNERFTYAPIVIKNHEVVEPASTRRTLEGSLERLRPSAADYHDGVGTRSSLPLTRSALSLAQTTRVLGTLGHADPAARVGVIDRHRRLWWLELAGHAYPRFNLAIYDRLHAERLEVLLAHQRWLRDGGVFPTVPYWHRDCPECPYAEHCQARLDEADDVSLVRFTTLDQQLALREHGVETRAQLAQLDPERARRARATAPIPLVGRSREELLGRSIDKLDDLIYRARAHERGSSLRVLAAEQMGCEVADVEVDVDMESYDDATYLWGAHVTLNAPVAGLQSGYRAFVHWGELTHESEAEIFREFWSFLNDLRTRADAEGRSFAAYCFWARAEDGAMNRAVDPPLDGGPTLEDLMTFRRANPVQWIDLHERAKRQIQTEGPLGLKQLAVAAGFRWRDPNPSGEASILWYEEATRPDSPDAELARERLVQYNEDDCLATKALRDWLNGPARSLAHRDDPL